MVGYLVRTCDEFDVLMSFVHSLVPYPIFLSFTSIIYVRASDLMISHTIIIILGETKNKSESSAVSMALVAGQYHSSKLGMSMSDYHQIDLLGSKAD